MMGYIGQRREGGADQLAILVTFFLLTLGFSTEVSHRVGIVILVRRSRGNTEGVLEMYRDPERQMSHLGCIGDEIHRTQERRRGRLVSCTDYIYYNFILFYWIILEDWDYYPCRWIILLL